MMNNLPGTPGELHATIHITRKATGLVETYHLVGHVLPDQQENDDVSNPLDGGKERGNGRGDGPDRGER